jgi:hypothetical protein
LIGGFYRLIITYQWLPVSLFVLFALGNYLAGSLFHLLTSFGSGSWLGIIVALALVTICTLAILVGLRRN